MSLSHVSRRVYCTWFSYLQLTLVMRVSIYEQQTFDLIPYNCTSNHRMCYRLLESSPENANVRRGRKEVPHAKECPDLKEY